MKYIRKGHKDRNRLKNRLKRSGQALLVYVRDTGKEADDREALILVMTRTRSFRHSVSKHAGKGLRMRDLIRL